MKKTFEPIDLNNCKLAGYNAIDLIKIAGMMKNSQSWQINATELFTSMQPVMEMLLSEDTKRLDARKISSVSDISRKMCDRQTQRLRVLYQIFGWVVHEMTIESEMINEVMNHLMEEAFTTSLIKDGMNAKSDRSRNGGSV